MEHTKVLHALDEFAKVKPKDIPAELDEYLRYVASSGDPVYQWSLVKNFFRQKMINVISEFYESCPMMDVPISPNVDPFNYETMKTRLLERYDTFSGAPYTIQRIAELLTTPRKQYNHVDKFMRAIEKNIWVVSTREPGRRDSAIPETLVNGVLSTVVHANNTKPTQERLQRQSELFDDDDEDEEPAVEIPSLEPLLSSEEDEPTPVDTASVPLDASPDLKQVQQDSDASPLPENNSEESTSEGELEVKSAEIPTEPESEPTEEVSEDAEPPMQTEIVEKAEDHLVEETIQAEDKPVDYEQKTPEEPEEEEEDAVEPEEAVSPVVEEENQKESKKPLEKLAVTEVTETETEEESTEGEPSQPSQPQPEPILEEPDDEPQESIPEPAIETDLKRKFDETGDGEDERDSTPSKRLETEDLAPVVEQPVETPEIPEAAEETVQELPAAAEVVQTEAQEEPLEAKQEVIAEITEATSIQVLDEEEGVMESSEMEEKLEMVVEENDQAMEVDEADGQVQSPMAEEDVSEPMEQSDLGNS